MASGELLFVFQPRSSQPPAANFAALDERGGLSVLDFDDTTNEETTFVGVMPGHYAGGGVQVILHWAMTSATTGDVDWDARFQRQTAITADDYAAVQSQDNNTVPGSAGTMATTTITFTNGAQMDSVVVGDLFRLSIIRDATNDTASGDAELVAVVVKEV